MTEVDQGNEMKQIGEGDLALTEGHQVALTEVIEEIGMTEGDLMIEKKVIGGEEGEVKKQIRGWGGDRGDSPRRGRGGKAGRGRGDRRGGMEGDRGAEGEN